MFRAAPAITKASRPSVQRTSRYVGSRRRVGRPSAPSSRCASRFVGATCVDKLSRMTRSSFAGTLPPHVHRQRRPALRGRWELDKGVQAHRLVLVVGGGAYAVVR